MYSDRNVFAQILKKEIPCEIVYEDDVVLAFKDISPAAPIHVLVITKEERISFSDFIDNSQSIESFFKSVKKVISKLNLEKLGYRLITNHGKYAGQEVDHFHIHILSGKPLGKLLA